MSAPRVLVTGPVEALSEYADAARRAGWEAIERPLLRIDPRPFDPARLRATGYDWICVTSANALPFLASALEALPGLRSACFAAVGERIAARLETLGPRPAFEPADDAADLARGILSRAPRGARVLWPRGSLSEDLARRLREGGLEVDDPIAYTTQPIPNAEPTPEAEAVFFASPSAVRLWHERPADSASRRQVAIAIGATTFDALLQETEARFFDTISLPQPTPEAFGIVLAHLDVSTPP